MFTISVCMIVKNESEVLERALSCAAQFADEIVVVDTGSHDNTKKIASKYTNKVFDFAWQDDFSAARNFSFSKATCDYQMWLDADDFISDENIQKLQLLKQNKKDVDVYMCKYLTGKDLELSYYRERLLKRDANFLWQGFVHEAIPPRGKIIYTDIEIFHKKQKPAQPKRNLKIYQKALKNGVKFGAREQYYYSRELYYNHEYSSCIKAMKKFLKMDGFTPDNLCAHIILSDCYILKNDIKNALKILHLALAKHLPTSELCCKLGSAYDLSHSTQNAIFWFKAALVCQPQKNGFVYKDYEGIIPLLELTRLLYNSGQIEEAAEYHNLAKASFPNHPSVVFNNQFFK